MARAGYAGSAVVSSDYAIYRQLVSQLLAGEEQLPSLPSITLEIRRALSQGKPAWPSWRG